MSYVVRTMFDGYGRDGKRTYNKGGGGGGSSQVYYANQDKLLGTQADIAQNMYNVYAENAPARLEAMDRMVNEAMDGTLADRARGQAQADAGTALTNSLNAASRNLERYGTTLNASALSANQNDAALMGAATVTGAKNRATQWAEGQKWARNADMYGALQGMPGTATQALGSAASGYGQMAGQQNQVNMANAQGYGQLGGMIGYGLMARDGGYIHEGEVIRRHDEPAYGVGGEVAGYIEQMQPGGFVGDVQGQAYDFGHPGGWVGDKMEQMTPGGSVGEIYNRGMPGRQQWLQKRGYAQGGHVYEPHFAVGGYAMPKLNDWRSYPTTQQSTSTSDTPSVAGQIAMGAAPALGMNLAKPYLKAGVNYVKDGIKDAWNQGVQAYDHAQKVAGYQAEAGKELAEIQAAQNSAAEGASSGLTSGTADAASGGALANGAETAAIDTAATTGAETAATDAAVTAGAEAGTEAAAEAAATAAAEEAVAAAAAEEAAALAAAETAATAEAAGTASLMGPVGWAAAAGIGLYGVGSAMDWWADGGPVPHEPMPNRGLRKNMIPGGAVRGPGTPTSDSIPAWLSNGEYVINADAVKEVGKDKLEKINEKGLKKRKAKAKAKAAAPKAAGLKKKPVAKK